MGTTRRMAKSTSNLFVYMVSSDSTVLAFVLSEVPSAYPCKISQLVGYMCFLLLMFHLKVGCMVSVYMFVLRRELCSLCRLCSLCLPCLKASCKIAEYSDSICEGTVEVKGRSDISASRWFCAVDCWC